MSFLLIHNNTRYNCAKAVERFAFQAVIYFFIFISFLRWCQTYFLLKIKVNNVSKKLKSTTCLVQKFIEVHVSSNFVSNSTAIQSQSAC